MSIDLSNVRGVRREGFDVANVVSTGREGDDRVGEGHEFPTTRFRIDATKVREFIRAVGVQPREGYVVQAGAPVPLGYLMYVVTYGAEPVHDALQMDMLKSVYGGAEYDLREPVHVGDEIEVQTLVSGATSKEGSTGRLTIYELTTKYVRPEDQTVLLVETSTTVERG